MSCSAHNPKLSTEGEVTMVSLSRPFVAMALIAAPSHAPGLSCVGTKGAQTSVIKLARSSNVVMSTPVRAAGTSPKYDKTE